MLLVLEALAISAAIKQHFIQHKMLFAVKLTESFESVPFYVQFPEEDTLI